MLIAYHRNFVIYLGLVLGLGLDLFHDFMLHRGFIYISFVSCRKQRGKFPRYSLQISSPNHHVLFTEISLRETCAKSVDFNETVVDIKAYRYSVVYVICRPILLYSCIILFYIFHILLISIFYFINI